MTQPSLLDSPVRFDGACVEPQDHARLGEQLARVLDVMRDGDWHSVDGVKRAIWALYRISDPETSISAQLRNLRKSKHGGYAIERKRVENHSFYRLVRS